VRAFRFVLILTGAILLLQIPAHAAPGGGITGTAHDFSAGGGADPCTFCHAPHRVGTTVLMWNHTLSRNTFSWGTPATTAGTVFPVFRGDTYTGPTAKCLGCHDGSVAVGSLAWSGSDGAGSAFAETRLAWPSPFNVGASGGVSGSLRGLHPVVMPYPFGGRNIYNGVMTGGHLSLAEWEADPQALNIRLYTDKGGGLITPGTGGLATGIECSSCHDPHNKASVETKFLRGRLSGPGTDYLCRKCHNK
jgi:predicted CXXCH cytochrome family protein